LNLTVDIDNQHFTCRVAAIIEELERIKMISITSVKNNILKSQREIKFAFGLLWQFEKILFLLYIIKHIIRLAGSFVMVYFPMLLLNGLSDGDYFLVIMVVLLYSLWLFISDLLKEWIGYHIGIREGSYRDRVSLLIYEKATSLRYEQLASTVVQEKYSFSQRCRDEGNVQGLVDNTFSFFSSIALISGLLYILRDYPWWLLVVIISGIVLHSIGKVQMARYNYHHFEEEGIINRKMNYYVDDMAESAYAKEIRVFTMQSFLKKKHSELIEKLFKLNKKYTYSDVKVLWWVKIVGAAERILIYGYNVIRFFQSNLTVGQLSMNISAFLNFTGAVDNIFNCLISIGEQIVYLESFSEFLRIESSYVGSKSLPEGEGIIQFENVTFYYPGQTKPALQNINVTIPFGEKLSIAGQNGAGKTTFVYLLLGLYKPTEGRILYNGTDIEELDPDKYAKLFAPVLQDYNIFKFRIVDNITFKEELTDEQLKKAWKAIEDIGLAEAVNHKAEGINSYITQLFSSRGTELSGGESQKLVIARNLYRNSPVMILDEPTSALSPKSEYEIYKKFNDLTQSRTVVYISHRLASCSLCDRILVFEEGQIIEEGSHSELMGKNNKYAEMYNRQLALYGLEEKEVTL